MSAIYIFLIEIDKKKLIEYIYKVEEVNIVKSLSLTTQGFFI